MNAVQNFDSYDTHQCLFAQIAVVRFRRKTVKYTNYRKFRSGTCLYEHNAFRTYVPQIVAVTVVTLYEEPRTSNIFSRFDIYKPATL